VRTVSRIILGGVLAVLLGFSPASAEWYVSGYAGVAIPNNQDIDITASASGLFGSGTLKDVDLDTSVVFGGKVGYFFEDWPYFGLELESYHFSPDVGAQTFAASGTILGVPAVATVTTLAEFDIGVTSIALNAILRGMTAKSDAFPEGRFHGYIGLGPGIFIANLEIPVTPSIDDTSTVVGGQVLAGVKFFVIEHLSLFAEYKFIFTDKFEFEFSAPGASVTLNTGMTTNLIYGGIAYHF
jgi:opacity protein-like surface antigen